MKTPHVKLIGRSPLRYGFLLIPLALAWFALSSTVRAVTPAPDGGYPGGNTAEGEDALFNLDTSQGLGNTAIGFDALSLRLAETPPAAAIQPPAGMCSLSTPPATTTRLTGLLPSIATAPAATTQPSASMRSLAIQPATTTRPPVLTRSL